MEVTKKKSKAEGAADKSGINYDFHHSGWSFDDSEDAQLYLPRHILKR